MEHEVGSFRYCDPRWFRHHLHDGKALWTVNSRIPGIKSRNIILDKWDCGLAKILALIEKPQGARVMGNFDYASAGMLNERSDFRVLIMEIISG